MERTDSIGNVLPQPKIVHSSDELGEALAINTFLLSCEVSMKNGDIVIYDKDLKQANITSTDGSVEIVHH